MKTFLLIITFLAASYYYLSGDKKTNNIDVTQMYTSEVIYSNTINISNIEYLTDVEFYILETLKNTNYSFFIVGGWTRDRLLGREPNDFDLVVNASNLDDLQNYINTIFDNRDRFIQKNPNLSYLTYDDYKPNSYKSTGESEFLLFGKSIDLDILRSNLSYWNNSYTPTNDVKLDIMTRDFTVNSIYYNYEERKIEDYCNGIKDLKTNTLRLINNRNPMLNNPFTIYRIIKMLVKYNMSLDDSLNETLHNSNYTKISESLLTRELKRFEAEYTSENRFITEFKKLFLKYNIDCKLCIFKKMKEYKLFRFYIANEYTEFYLNNRISYDNYIFNIAIISQYFMINTNIDNYLAFKYIYREIFDSPFCEEKYLGLLRFLRNNEYQTSNKYLLAIPIAINYCKKVNCFEEELTFINIDILKKLYRKDNLTGSYYMKIIN